MRLLVVSDTHGKADLQRIAQLATDADMVIHLGDGFPDGQMLGIMQDAPVIQVLGNADLPLAVVPEKLIEVEGWTLMLTHGHQYHVKKDLVRLIGAAHDRGAQLVLFGHVHRRVWEEAGSVRAFNPSSAAYTYDGSKPSVGWLELEPGRVRHRWIELEA